MKLLTVILILGICMTNINAKISAPNEIDAIATDQFKCVTETRIEGNVHFHELSCYLKKNLKNKIWSFHADLPKSKKNDPKLEKDVQFQTYFFEFVKIEDKQIVVGLASPPYAKYNLEIKTGKIMSIGFWRTTSPVNK